MRCEVCQGRGHLPQVQGERILPCPACLNGEVNCCDGICEQPEKDDDANNDAR
jgi:hypothetical protein